MRFILRKYVDADNAQEALNQDKATPVHDVYLKDGEEPKRPSGGTCNAVGFLHPNEPQYGYDGEPVCGKKQ